MARVTCPSCHAALTIQPQAAGQTVRCPACGYAFAVAFPEAAPQQADWRQAPPAPQPQPPPIADPGEESDDPVRPRGRLPTPLLATGIALLIVVAVSLCVAIFPRPERALLGDDSLSEPEAVELVKAFLRNNGSTTPLEQLQFGPNMSRQEMEALLDEGGVPDAARAPYDADWFICVRGPAQVHMRGWPKTACVVLLVKGKLVIDQMGFSAPGMTADDQKNWRQVFRLRMAQRYPAIKVDPKQYNRHQTEPSPAEVSGAFLDNLKQHKIDIAYSMTSQAYQKIWTKDQFKDFLNAFSFLTDWTSRTVQTASPTSPGDGMAIVTMQLRSRPGAKFCTIELSKEEDSGWKVNEVQGMPSAKAVAEAFLDDLKQRKIGDAYALMSRPYRNVVTQEGFLDYLKTVPVLTDWTSRSVHISMSGGLAGANILALLRSGQGSKRCQIVIRKDGANWIVQEITVK